MAAVLPPDYNVVLTLAPDLSVTELIVPTIDALVSIPDYPIVLAIDNVKGEPGSVGPAGPTGPQGPQGAIGHQGSTGPAGPQGPAGVGLNMKGTVASASDLPASGNAANDTYTALDTGHAWTWTGAAWIDIGPIQGPQGASGVQGPDGPQGPIGQEGATGGQGPEGASGIQGPQGDQGPTGPPGNQGPPGVGLNWQGAWNTNTAYSIDDGVSSLGSSYVCVSPNTGIAPPNATYWSLFAQGGAPGPTGPPGATGSQGATGAQGLTGSTGAQGATGPQGLQGSAGATGSQGPQGSQGAQGVQGPTGPQGTGITVKGIVPTAADLPMTGNTPGDMWVASDTGHGWSWDGAKWVDSGPVQGPTGATGPQGPTGAQGASGAAGSVGPVGPTGPQGPASTVPGPPGPSTPSANAGNLLTAGTDSLLYLPPSALNPEIWSVRLRSFNAIGNPTFEVDQRQCGAGTTTAGTFAQDRWIRGGNLSFSAQQTGSLSNIPGTNFAISRYIHRITLTAQKTTLAATDVMQVYQYVEGCVLRELINDVHSVSILCRSSVGPTSFSIRLTDSAVAYTLSKLCTLTAANTWTLITLPNIPIWSPSGTFPTTPGSNGYAFGIGLAVGSTYMSPANDTWQSGNFIGAVGMGNFAANPVNSTFDIAFVQHEPGLLCTTLIDKPFTANYDECLRYFQKTWNYGVAIGTSSSGGVNGTFTTNSGWAVGFPGFNKPMAKAPTVVIYDSSNGTANSIFLPNTGIHVAVNSVAVNEKGVDAINVSSGGIASAWVQCNYTADTGW